MIKLEAKDVLFTKQTTRRPQKGTKNAVYVPGNFDL